MIVLVCGGRNYCDVDKIYETLDSLGLSRSRNDSIISGMATGADNIAELYADLRGIPFCGFPADWHTYGKSAGYVRNKQMLDEGKPDLVVAFPGGKGTAMMVDMATKAGVKVMQMGTLGFSSQAVDLADSAASLKTERFIKLYFQRIAELGSLSPVLKSTLMQEVMKEEREWLASMGSEYEEIMQAQDLIDKIQT